VAGKANIASPQIFSTDPIEQQFAKGLADPEFSGYAYGFLNAARGDRRRAQDTYISNLQMSNKMAAQLEQQAMAQDLLKESLKQGPEYAKAGLPINQVDLIARLFNSGGSDPQTMDASGLVNELKRSQIAENNAKAAGSTKESGPQYEFAVDTTTSGVGAGTHKIKGGDPAALQAALYQAVNRDRIARGLPPVKPGQELSRPTKTSEREQLQTRAANERRILQGQ